MDISSLMSHARPAEQKTLAGWGGQTGSRACADRPVVVCALGRGLLKLDGTLETIQSFKARAGLTCRPEGAAQGRDAPVHPKGNNVCDAGRVPGNACVLTPANKLFPSVGAEARPSLPRPQFLGISDFHGDLHAVTKMCPV